MPTVNTQTNITLPKAHESSALRSPRDSDDVHRQWKRANTSTAQQSSDTIALFNLTRKVEAMRRRILGGLPNQIPDRWQKPYKELDPTVAVTEGTWVYISPSNDLVLTGYTDPTGGAGTKAYPGIWEAAQDVPPTDGTNYNVPQTDYPGATGTPSGSPLQGDLDGTGVYWILICPTCGL